MLDFHVHLARLPKPLSTAKELCRSGYKANLVACEPWEWDACAPLFSEIQESLTPCFGIHPMIAEDVQSSDMEHLESWIQKFPQAFVGECGLDKRFPGYAPGETQEKLLIFQAKLAIQYKRPLMLHMVGDYRRVLTILENLGYPNSESFPIFHRFGGDEEVVKRGIPLNAIFSIHPDSFRKMSTRAALRKIPKEHIRFETDANESFPVQNPDGTTKAPREIAEVLIQDLNAVEQALQNL